MAVGRRTISRSAEGAATTEQRYVVKGSDIWTSKGRIAEGDVVALPPSEARHFDKLDRLKPYIPDESETEVAVDDDPADV